MFIKVRPTEVYVVERLGKFYKVFETGRHFIIPFIDKVKEIVNLESTVIKTEIHKTFLENGKEIFFQFKIDYHITDPIKATYESRNLSSIKFDLQLLAITTFRNIVLECSSNDIEYIIELAKNNLKTELNKKVYNIGCEINQIEIELVPKP